MFSSENGISVMGFGRLRQSESRDASRGRLTKVNIWLVLRSDAGEWETFILESLVQQAYVAPTVESKSGLFGH